MSIKRSLFLTLVALVCIGLDTGTSVSIHHGRKETVQITVDPLPGSHPEYAPGTYHGYVEQSEACKEAARLEYEARNPNKTLTGVDYLAQEQAIDDETVYLTDAKVAAGPDGLRLCATTRLSKCDRLLMRNTHDIFMQREKNYWYDLDHELFEYNSSVWYAEDEMELEKEMEVEVYFHSFAKSHLNKTRIQRATIDNFMEKLEIAFADSRIEFEYEGQTVTVNPTWYNCQDVKVMKKSTRKKGAATLNVWLCNTTVDNFVGHATFPNVAFTEGQDKLDGIMLLNPELPRSGDMVDEMIYWQLVHQVGHWLGLLHPYTGGCHLPADEIVENPSTTDKSLGDGITDTPPQASHSWDVPGQKNCWQTRAENGNPVNTCSESPEPDDVNNYMNLLPPHCMKDYGHFTPEQINRMESLFYEYRMEDEFYSMSGFIPSRSDIIEICLEDIMNDCKCDYECVKMITAEIMTAVEVGASTDLLVDGCDAECVEELKELYDENYDEAFEGNYTEWAGNLPDEEEEFSEETEDKTGGMT